MGIGQMLVGRGLHWGRPAGPEGRAPLTLFRSDPARERLEGNDSQTYIQPLPKEIQFQTYWAGNQLPGVHIATGPHAWYVRQTSQDYAGLAQRSANYGALNQMGQVQTGNLMSRWHSLWNKAG